MSVPWVFSLGYMITYGALFSKLWRVNKVLQPVRRKIDIKQVLWPFLVLVGLTVLILGLWTGLDPLEWEREVINDVTGESIGQCQSDTIVAFIVPLILVLLVPTLLTGYMAWCTKDVDEGCKFGVVKHFADSSMQILIPLLLFFAFSHIDSESYWIFIMVLVQCEVILFAAPMFALLRDVSTDGRYVGFVVLIWTFPMSTLGLIIGPKTVAFRRARLGATPSRRGRSTRDVHVTGVTGSGSSVPKPPSDSLVTPRESRVSSTMQLEEDKSLSSAEQERPEEMIDASSTSESAPDKE